MLKEKYTLKQEKAFLAWIRTLPSCLSGNTPCVAAHIRRVSEGAGMGRKPRLFAVPMTNEEHQYQHNHGEMAVLIKYTRFNDIITYHSWEAKESSKIWFNNLANKYREKFLKEIWK